jgi:hypothetical protein
MEPMGANIYARTLLGATMDIMPSRQTSSLKRQISSYLTLSFLSHEVPPMRKISFTLLAVSVLLLLAACGASSTDQPYSNRQTVTALSAKVAARYGETNPKITKVTATLTDGPAAVSMNLVSLDGQFHKGSLVATHLSFSMLSDGSKVWAILATDDQYPVTHRPAWLDEQSDIRL